MGRINCGVTFEIDFKSMLMTKVWKGLLALNEMSWVIIKINTALHPL